MALFLARVAKKTATNICENWLRKLLHFWWKTTKTLKMQGFSPSAQNRQLGKSSPRPKNIGFSQSRTLSCFFIKKWAFHLQARKHCKNAGKTPFFGPRALKKNTLLRHLLLSRAQTSYPSRPTSCPYPFLGPKNWFFKPNNILPLPFSAHLCPPPPRRLEPASFLRILATPSGGGMLDIHT